MKPFNLEEALAGKPVITRDGRPTTNVLHLKNVDGKFKVVTTVDGMTHSHKENGCFYADETPCCLDLFMAPVKKEGQVNIYGAFDNEYHIASYPPGWRAFHHSKTSTDAGFTPLHHKETQMTTLNFSIDELDKYKNEISDAQQSHPEPDQTPLH